MSQSQPPESQDSNGMNRRAFLRRGAAGTAALGGLAYAKPPVQNVQAFPPALVAGGALAAGVAAGYITRSIQDYVTADDFDEEAYEEAEAEQIFNDQRATARQIQENDETVLTTIENNLSFGQNAALSEAKKDAIEQLNLGNGEEAALDTAKEANDAYWSIPQENLVRHSNVQTTIIGDMAEVDYTNFHLLDEDDEEATELSSTSPHITDMEITLLNGEVITSVALRSLYNSSSYTFPGQSGPAKTLRHNSDFDKTSLIFFDLERYNSILDEINDNHAEVESELETLIPAYADGYESGDISLADVISPSDIANNAADSDGFAYAGADLASLGLSSIGGNWDIRLEESDTVVRGTIYLLTDETLTTGQTYSPSSIAGPVYLAYEWEDGQFDDEPAGSDLVALEQDFTILGGTAGEWVDGEDGERVYEIEAIGEGEEITFTETYQSTTDTDIEAFREELRTLRERNQELEEQQLAAAGGGGLDLSALSIGGLSGELVALIAAAIVAIFAFKDDDKNH